jgi:hypothetical protein
MYPASGGSGARQSATSVVGSPAFRKAKPPDASLFRRPARRPLSSRRKRDGTGADGEPAPQAAGREAGPAAWSFP